MRPAGRTKLLVASVAVLALALALGVGVASAVAPAVSVENATNVSYTSAEAEGQINPEGQETSYHFEYATEEQFTNSEWAEAAQVGFGSIAADAGLSPVTEALTGLTPDTTYHLRLVAENADGPGEGVAANTFKTLAAMPPVALSASFSEVQYTSAKAEGEVETKGADPAFNASTCRFEYVTGDQFTNEGEFAQAEPNNQIQSCDTEPTGEDATTPVQAQLTGLKPATTYHLRLFISNQAGSDSAVAASTFTTEAVTIPTPGTPQVSGIAGHSATFEGSVDPGAPEDNSALSQAAKDAYATHWWFTCEPSCSFDGPSEGDVEADDEAVDLPPVQATGLLANRQYKVILHAKNAGGEEEAETQFTTGVVVPEVEVNQVGAFEPSPTAVTVNGAVNPEGSRVTDCHVVYGVGSASGNEAPCTPAHPAVNETQIVAIRAIAGQFKLSFESDTTGDLSYDAGASEVQAALEGLPAIGAGNVSVSGGPANITGDTPYVVSFEGDLAGIDVPKLEVESGGTPLEGGVFVSTGNDGGIRGPNEDPNESQHLIIGGESGQFKLSFESDTTGDLASDISAEQLQTALEGLPSIGAGNVSVEFNDSVGPGGFIGYFVIGFQGDLSSQDLPQITASTGTTPLAGQRRVDIQPDGSLSVPVPVSAELTGLAPNTEYIYKIVATNAGGPGESDEQHFRTPSAPGEQACPNQARREEQHLFPAECRAYEMVSPIDKNGANITGEGTNVVAAADGNAAVFQSRGGFAGTIGSGRTGFTQYLSRRGAGGWSTKSILPTPSGTSAQALLGGDEFFFFDDELRKGVLWGFDLPGSQDDLPNVDNLYRMDTDSGELQTVTQATQLAGPLRSRDYKGIGETWGASSDTSVVSFPSKTKLLPVPEINPSVRNTYEWDNGTLRLAGILPDGSVPSGGSTPPMYKGGQGYRESVSSDGSRLAFYAPFTGNQNLRQLYLRRNHTDTVWVSEPESPSFTGKPEKVELQWVSPDGHKLLFTTSSSLLEEDENEGVDLYLYTDGPDPESESNNLTLISHSGSLGLPNPENVVNGVSDDASRIYFSSQDGSLRLWDKGVTHLVAQLGYGSGDAFASVVSAPGETRASSTGRILAFLGTGDPSQMYVYDAVNNTLACASCAAVGPTTSAVSKEPNVSDVLLRKSVQQLRPRFLSDDGSKVFFSTAQALVPEDTNGVTDAYVYNTHTGQRELISSGKGEEGQWFVNASSSGDDAFILTADKLVSADPDNLVDLYDSRVSGGFVEPPPPPAPCSGDGCRGALSGASNTTSPSTASFSGPGNPKHKAGKPHKKKHQKKHRHRSKGHVHGKAAQR